MINLSRLQNRMRLRPNRLGRRHTTFTSKKYAMQGYNPMKPDPTGVPCDPTMASEMYVQLHRHRNGMTQENKHFPIPIC